MIFSMIINCLFHMRKVNQFSFCHYYYRKIFWWLYVEYTDYQPINNENFAPNFFSMWFPTKNSWYLYLWDWSEFVCCECREIKTGYRRIIHLTHTVLHIFDLEGGLIKNNLNQINFPSAVLLFLKFRYYTPAHLFNLLAGYNSLYTGHQALILR